MTTFSEATKKNFIPPCGFSSKELSFQFFLQFSPSPMLFFDRKSLAVLFVNAAAVRHYGYSEIEFLKLTVPDLYSPSEAQSFISGLNETLKGPEPAETECRHRKKDGTLFPANVLYCPVALDGREAGFSMVMDVKNHEFILSALRNTEEKFHSFMEHNPATAWIKDENFRYIYCNPNLEDLLRSQYGPPLGKNDFDLFPEEVARQLRENDNAVLNSGKPLKTVEAVPNKDGILRYWVVSKFLIPGPNGTRMIAGEAYDITEQKSAEEKIRFQASLLNQVRNALIVIDRDMKIIYWNRFAETLYQWRSEEVLGRHVFEIMVPEKSWPLASAIIAELEQTGHWEGEFMVQRKDKSCFSALVTSAGLKNERDEVIGFIGITSDLTDYKASQKALQEKNIALKEILSQLELEKREIRDRLAGNIDKFVFPVLKKMRRNLDALESQHLDKHFEMLEHSLQEVVAPLNTQLASKLKCLTHKELEICNLLRGGFSSKEIAKMLEISPATVETHRVRIRRKLKIQDRKVNLTSYLQR